MKKLVSIFAFSVLGVSLLFTSCKKEDETVASPVITFTGKNMTITNDTLKLTEESAYANFTIDVTADGEIASGKLEKAVGNQSASVTAFGTALAAAKGKTSMSYEVKDSLAVGTYKYTVTITDDADVANTSTKTLVVVVKAKEVVLTPLSKTKNGVIYHIQASTGNGAWDLVDDVARFSSASATTKDIINSSDNTSGSAFVSGWNAGNTTLFVKANSFDYANATFEAAKAAYAAGSGSQSVTVAANDIIIAKLRGNDDYAVIKITKVDPNDASHTGGSNKGIIEFEYKKK